MKLASYVPDNCRRSPRAGHLGAPGALRAGGRPDDGRSGRHPRLCRRHARARHDGRRADDARRSVRLSPASRSDGPVAADRRGPGERPPSRSQLLPGSPHRPRAGGGLHGRGGVVIDARGASLVSIVDGVRAGTFSAREVTEQFLDRAARLDGALGCFLKIDETGARRRADAVDGARKEGRDAGPLAGAPIGIKDIFCMRGVETTCASKILRGFVPPYESTVTARLEAAGAIALGKLNMDEFAMGSSTENSSVKPTRNPWSPAHVPGGSSGGSAAAVAASLCAGATGTDTGGSIRQPAALCGVVGVKPTYGRVSRYGVIAFASSLDHPGPFGRTVEDAAALLEVMAGPDPLDATSIPQPVGAYRQAARAGLEDKNALKGVRLGVPAEYFQPGMDPEVEAAVRAALDELGRAGVTIVDVSLPHTRYAIATYYLICTAEAASNLA